MWLVKLHHSSLVLLLAGALAGAAQEKDKPVEFSGEVRAGQAFRKPIGRGLVFLLQPDDDGWTIEVGPENAAGQSCKNFSTVIAIPLRGYTENDLSVSYGITAEEAVKTRPHEVAFVLTEGDCKRESQWSNRLLWPRDFPAEQVKEAQDRFGRSAGGKAVLRIRDSKISPTGELVNGKDAGKIDWIKFEVEIAFTAPR